MSVAFSIEKNKLIRNAEFLTPYGKRSGFIVTNFRKQPFK